MLGLVARSPGPVVMVPSMFQAGAVERPSFLSRVFAVEHDSKVPFQCLLTAAPGKLEIHFSLFVRPGTGGPGEPGPDIKLEVPPGIAFPSTSFR